MSTIEGPIPVAAHAIPAASKEAQLPAATSADYTIPKGCHAIPADQLDLRPDAVIDQEILNPKPITLDSDKNVFFFWHSGFQDS
jgi:hypothetical protein